MNAPARIALTLPGTDAGILPAPLMPSLERRRLQCYLGLLIADIVALTAGFVIAGELYMGSDGVPQALLFIQLVLPVFLTAAIYNGAYSILSLRQPKRGIGRSLLALAIAIAFVQFIAFYAKANEDFSRVIVALGTVIAFLLIVWVRLQMRWYVHWRCGNRVINELVIDDEGPALTIEGTCRISARSFGLVPALDDPHSLHRIGLVLRNADRVIVSCPPERRAAWAMIFKGANVFGHIIDQTMVELGASGASIIDGQGLIEVSSGPLGLRSRLAKRVLDLSLAGTAALLLAPLLLLVACAILIEDGRPVFFIQRRLGRGNRFFAMYKFRSMTTRLSDADGRTSASREDERIIRVGKLIRRTSIDELPQLLNVLRGDMSLVGPRPHAIGSQAGDKLFWEVDTRYWQRHALKPGITGLAQIRGWRGATDSESHLQGRLTADLEYLRGWSLWRDVRIMLATLRVLIHDRAF